MGQFEDTDVVSFNQAVQLMNIGYPQRVILNKSNDRCYCTEESAGYSSGIVLKVGDLTTYNVCNTLCADSIEAPTLHLAVKWFIKEKHIAILPYPAGDLWMVHFYNTETKKFIAEIAADDKFDSYEMALSSGIDKVIEYFKNQSSNN